MNGVNIAQLLPFYDEILRFTSLSVGYALNDKREGETDGISRTLLNSHSSIRRLWLFLPRAA